MGITYIFSQIFIENNIDTFPMNSTIASGIYYYQCQIFILWYQVHNFTSNFKFQFYVSTCYYDNQMPIIMEIKTAEMLLLINSFFFASSDSLSLSCAADIRITKLCMQIKEVDFYERIVISWSANWNHFILANKICFVLSLKLKLQHHWIFLLVVITNDLFIKNPLKTNWRILCGRLISERRIGTALRDDYNLQRVMRIQSLIFIPILITIFVTTMVLQRIIFHPCYSLCQKNETSAMPSAFLTPLPYALLYFSQIALRNKLNSSDEVPGKALITIRTKSHTMNPQAV